MKVETILKKQLPMDHSIHRNLVRNLQAIIRTFSGQSLAYRNEQECWQIKTLKSYLGHKEEFEAMEDYMDDRFGRGHPHIPYDELVHLNQRTSQPTGVNYLRVIK